MSEQIETHGWWNEKLWEWQIENTPNDIVKTGKLFLECALIGISVRISGLDDDNSKLSN